MLKIQFDKEKIHGFCTKWLIAELSIFGSALRDDFKPDSDVDVLITFSDNAHWSLFDWLDMIEELKIIFGRDVDLVSSKGLRNPYRRKEILSTREVIYAA